MPDQIEKLISRLSLRQLEVFRAVYQERGYGKAADRLGLTQPAVSSQIRQLEQALGQKVFEYIGRKLYYTPAGNLLADSVNVIFSQFGQLQNDIHTLKGQVAGNLSISAVNTAQYVVPYLIKAFIKQYDQVNLTLNIVNRAQALERLANNTDDLTIMGLVPSNRSLYSLPFLDNQLIPVFPKDHPLIKQGKELEQDRISPQQFFSEPMIIRERGSGSRLAIEQHCQQSRLTINPMIEIGSNEALKHSIMSGLGVGILPRLSILSELALGQLETRAIEGFPIKRSWCLVYPAAKSLSPVARQFVDYIQNNLADIRQLFE
jgi:DNA-binding transcriptional LysR family regulator